MSTEWEPALRRVGTSAAAAPAPPNLKPIVTKWAPRLAAALVFVAVVTGGWFYFKSRVIRVWVYTDYAFRFEHPGWSALVASRFAEVNRIYRLNGIGVRWDVLDASQTDPTSRVPGLDNRRASMALHQDRDTDVFVILTGVHERDRTGSVSPFTRVVMVVDYPRKSEALNAGLLARELACLFGAQRDPAWLESFLADKPVSDKFSGPIVALIKRMRGYPFQLGIDGLGSWDRKALAAVAQSETGPRANAIAHAHTVLGSALLSENKVEAALVHFKAAVQADPQDQTARLNLADAYARNGQEDLALEQTRTVVRMAPGDPLAHRALGALLGHMHQPEAAVGEFRAAARLDPQNAEYQVLLAVQLAGIFGHIDDSIAALKEAVRLNPDSDLARQSLEKAQKLKERVAAELVKERGLVHNNPNDPAANYRLAQAESRSGDLQGAIRDFRKSADLRPGDASTHTELAQLYLLTGDTGSAWAEIRRARALGTEPPPSLLARMPAQK